MGGGNSWRSRSTSVASSGQPGRADRLGANRPVGSGRPPSDGAAWPMIVVRYARAASVALSRAATVWRMALAARSASTAAAGRSGCALPAPSRPYDAHFERGQKLDPSRRGGAEHSSHAVCDLGHRRHWARVPASPDDAGRHHPNRSISPPERSSSTDTTGILGSSCQGVVRPILCPGGRQPAVAPPP
jgi:hypothetical protein